VLLANGAGGKLLGSVNCGPQPQVVTQWLSAAIAGAQQLVRMTKIPEKLRSRSAISIAANANRTFFKLRRSGMFFPRLMERVLGCIGAIEA
jgi:hypothetical protein